MLTVRRLFAIILFIYLIKFSSANHRQNQMNLNFLNFEQMKIDLFTVNKTAHQCKTMTQRDEKCLNELAAIGNGLKNLELWAIKRKINCFFFSNKLNFLNLQWLNFDSRGCMGKSSFWNVRREFLWFRYIFGMFSHWTKNGIVSDKVLHGTSAIWFERDSIAKIAASKYNR